MQLRDIQWYRQATDKLKELGVVWNFALHHPVRPAWPNFGRDLPSVHIYFMVGDHEVAYFTPIMETLTINEPSRQWCSSLVQKAAHFA